MRDCSSVETVILLSFMSTTLSTQKYEIETCSGDIQRNIFQSMPQCLVRATVVSLKEQFANQTDIVEIIPEHVHVNRCGGSCYVHHHSCNPIVSNIITVPVMLVQSIWPHGEHEIICSEVKIEVHQECQCGCQINDKDCNHLQYYHKSSCR